MSESLTRRAFVADSLKATAAGFAFLPSLPDLSAEDTKVTPKTVQLNSDIEPLVRLIEETPREKLLETVVDKIKKGTSYNELLSAVMLAGVRGIEPRPVGF